ncbi:unnamed protein product [Triticum turgidum subsp. durum]|uniref:KIB1-4 beta-propeller domain-containing protein n=2 Tax=Triticum TaxID=4564 RepID=A0A9R1R1S7_TRITD|nr:unnamed protein product [Triticum aestivum]VAH86687.1 unnamed protein product [Triticum turgidum subsp. durum]
MAAKILLAPLIYDGRLVFKMVFAPSPTSDDFLAAVICDINRLAYVTTRARMRVVLDPIHLAEGDQIADFLYHRNCMVNCLTQFGDVHVLRLPQHRRREPIILKGHMLAHLVVHNKWIVQMHGTGPDLNTSPTIETLLSYVGSNMLFDTSTGFDPPYNTISNFISANNLVLCDGNIYQIWRNASCMVRLQLPGRGRCRVEHDGIFVLWYDSQRRPYWDVVADLRGHSVFVGRNNAVSIYAEGVPGLKGDCKLCPAACHTFKLITIPSVRTCLGCRGAWLSLSICIDDGHSLLSLFHPVMATEILLPPLIYDRRLVSKMVFTPNPTKDDFLAAVICDINGFASVTAGTRRWAVLDPIRLDDGDQIADLLYHRNGMVYCLTRFRDVRVLHLPQHRCRNLSSSRATH